MKEKHIIVVVVLSFALLIGGHAFADSWGITPGDEVKWHPIGPALVGKLTYEPCYSASTPANFYFDGKCKGQIASYAGSHVITNFVITADQIEGSMSDIDADDFGDCIPNPNAALPDPYNYWSVIINNAKDLSVDPGTGKLSFDAVILFVAY